MQTILPINLLFWKENHVLTGKTCHILTSINSRTLLVSLRSINKIPRVNFGTKVTLFYRLIIVILPSKSCLTEILKLSKLSQKALTCTLFISVEHFIIINTLYTSEIYVHILYLLRAPFPKAVLFGVSIKIFSLHLCKKGSKYVALLAKS